MSSWRQTNTEGFHLLGILWVYWEWEAEEGWRTGELGGHRTHPDHHVVGKGGGVVHFGEGWRAGAHDFPAHVEHPSSPQGQEGHSEEETPISEHANVLQRHGRAPDVTDFQTEVWPSQVQLCSHSTWTVLTLCFKRLAILEFRLRKDFENGILNQLVLDIFHVRAGDKSTYSPLMTCPCVVPSGQFPEHLICLSPRCQRLHLNPKEAKRGNQWCERLTLIR